MFTMRFQGFKNDLKLAMDQVDQEYLQEILKSGGETSEQDLKNDVKVIEDGTTYEDILVSVQRYKNNDFHHKLFLYCMCRSLHIHLSSGHYHYVRNILMQIRDAHTVKWIITGRTFYFAFQKLSEGLGEGDENLDSEVVLKFLKV